MMKILIIDPREEGFDTEKKAFSKEDVTLMICQCKDEDELIEKAGNADIVIFTSSKISGRVISSLNNCKMLIRYGVGLENVDIKAATEKGIYVCNTPDYGTYAVAEHAFALLINVNRHLLYLDRYVRSGGWDISDIQEVNSLRGKVLGIIGFGNIGRLVYNMAAGFEMKIKVYDPFANEDVLTNYRVELVTFDEIVKTSDNITLHLPLTDKTFHLFNKKIFGRMKEGSVIINTSRGAIINQTDFVEALRKGKLAGAGLDVFESEPLDIDSELRKMDNVILTPHVAWYTQESIISLHQEVIDEVLRVIHGKIPKNAVNQILK